MAEVTEYFSDFVNNAPNATPGTEGKIPIVQLGVTRSVLASQVISGSTSLNGDVIGPGLANTVSKIKGQAVVNTTGSGNVVFSADPTLTGVPQAPTAAPGTSTTQIATTAFVASGDAVLQAELNATQLTGDVLAGPGAGSLAATLATVNSNVGTFQGLTVDAKGRVTAATNQNYLTSATAGTAYVAKGGDTMTGALNLPILNVASSKVYVDNQGIAVGYGGPVSSAGEFSIAALNTYTGAPTPPSNAQAMLGRLDFAPSGDDASNSTGGYNIIWVDSPRNFTGALSAFKGNAYVMAQITATIASGGSGNVVGDALTAVGGTCTANLNTPPQFYVASIGAGGAVTSVTYAKGLGACDPYPANPVSTTSSRGGAVPPALNLTVAPSPTVATLEGLYGRVRNQSMGTINEAMALFADGAWNTGGGTIGNAYALYCFPPYATGREPTNSYGVFFGGEFAQGEISAALNVDININSRGGGGIGLQPGNNGRVYIGYGTTVTATTGTTAGAGIYQYMTAAGVAYIDALVGGVGTSFLRARVYNNGTYLTGWEIANTGVVNFPQGAAAQAPISVSSASTSAGFTVTNTSATGYSQVLLDGTGRDFLVGVGNASEVTFGLANKFFVYDATANVPRMVIDNVGKVGIGNTASGGNKLQVTGSTGSTAGGYGIGVMAGPNGADSTTQLVGFTDGGNAVLVGAITRTGTNQTAYGTSSDERLKSDITGSDRGLDALLAIKVSDYKMGETHQQGLLAQDVYQVYPEAVHKGGDDPMTEPWMIDYGRLMPLAIRTIQQQQALIERLEARLAYLEAR